MVCVFSYTVPGWLLKLPGMFAKVVIALHVLELASSTQADPVWRDGMDFCQQLPTGRRMTVVESGTVQRAITWCTYLIRVHVVTSHNLELAAEFFPDFIVNLSLGASRSNIVHISVFEAGLVDIKCGPEEMVSFGAVSMQHSTPALLLPRQATEEHQGRCHAFQLHDACVQPMLCKLRCATLPLVQETIRNMNIANHNMWVEGALKDSQRRTGHTAQPMTNVIKLFLGYGLLREFQVPGTSDLIPITIAITVRHASQQLAPFRCTEQDGCTLRPMLMPFCPWLNGQLVCLLLQG